MKTKVDLNRVATFVRVVQAKSFTRAARELRLPISSVSRSVAQLEEALGVRLLHRTTRRLALTDAGRSYFERMQTVLAEAEAATNDVRGLAAAPTGLVRITAPEARLLGLAPLLASIIARHPGLEIELIVTIRRVDLIEEGVDLAIRAGQLEDSTLIAHRLGNNEFGVVAAPAYLERRGTPRSIADLPRHDCIRLRWRAGLLPWRFDNVRDEVPVKGPLVCDDMGILQLLTLEGVGLAYMPLELLEKDFSARRLVRVLPRMHWTAPSIYLVWPSQRLLPTRVLLVRDEILAHFNAFSGIPARPAGPVARRR